MSRPERLPRLYPIIDAALFDADKDSALAMARFAEKLAAGGATLIQLRNISSVGIRKKVLLISTELNRLA